MAILYESSYYGTSFLGNDCLYHHGIKGQKWGVLSTGAEIAYALMGGQSSSDRERKRR